MAEGEEVVLVQVNATDGSSLRHVRELIFEYTQASKVFFTPVPLPRNITTSPHRQSRHSSGISVAFSQPAYLCRSDSNVKCFLETLPVSTFASSLPHKKPTIHIQQHTHTRRVAKHFHRRESKPRPSHKISHAASSDTLSPSLSIYLTPCSRTPTSTLPSLLAGGDKPKKIASL